MEQQNKSSIGSIVGTIIIIALIILGGLYFWGKQMQEAKSVQNITTDETVPASGSTDTSEAAAIKSTSSSDNLDAIDADLQNTNTTNLDTELNASAQ